MNLAVMERPIGLDRLATKEEVRSALSFSSQSAREPVRSGACREVDCDFTSRSCTFSGDTMWLAIVSEAPDSRSN
jgi:hypothetical protein